MFNFESALRLPPWLCSFRASLKETTAQGKLRELALVCIPGRVFIFQPRRKEDCNEKDKTNKPQSLVKYICIDLSEFPPLLIFYYAHKTERTNERTNRRLQTNSSPSSNIYFPTKKFSTQLICLTYELEISQRSLFK